MIRVPFTKLAGAGNDFVLIDTLRDPLRELEPRWRLVAKTLCDRRRGIGADGLLVLGRSRSATIRMRIFNPDGSEPSMCGNGIRCLAWYANRRGVTPKRLSIETKVGIKRAHVLRSGRVSIDMGAPRFLGRWLGRSFGHPQISEVVLIDSGVPHLVCWVDDVAAVKVNALGRRLRRHARLRPGGANVDFIQSVGDANTGRLRLRMRTYERGVEGETQACGTGAVAAAAAAAARALERGGRARRFQVAVRVPGGLLRVAVAARRAARQRGRIMFSNALLEGEARQVARGTVAWNGGRSS